MGILRSHHRTQPLCRVWSTLFVPLLGSAVCLDKLFAVQTVCDQPRNTPIQVDSAEGLGSLQAALNCAGASGVHAAWAGVVTLDAPIFIAEGAFLSVTGEDDLAEVHGDSSTAKGTRLFMVSRGGGLTLYREDLRWMAVRFMLNLQT